MHGKGGEGGEGGEGKYRNMGDEDTAAAAADNTNPD